MASTKSSLPFPESNLLKPEFEEFQIPQSLVKGKKIKLRPAKPEEIQADRYVESIRKVILEETTIPRKVF
ncbi:hypothetical protein LEP1GSC062_1777 [Leptospira alexanderi serovar Manhao 3 str. L 60]|uniref:Uncharacterized protein n=1 Tax=Leptospira alexanderi serovar Manhao 3 str. L 60 TaxID=1049759 RepID=V6HU76_9LEPT|nr:hypothetical protein LEP1GSC062_1777 [Leptospira alexanderi serovar Manhao 3 str. L 60]